MVVDRRQVDRVYGEARDRADGTGGAGHDDRVGDAAGAGQGAGVQNAGVDLRQTAKVGDDGALVAGRVIDNTSQSQVRREGGVRVDPPT